MTKRQPKYTDKFRAGAVVMLMAAGWPDVKGAQSKVAKHLGVPRQTLMRWANEENNPAPPQLVQEKRMDMIQRLEDIRHLLLDEAEKAIPDAPLNHLLTGYGILTDKQRLLTGESTDNNAVSIKIRYGDD
jgi:transposase-like protein